MSRGPGGLCCGISGPGPGPGCGTTGPGEGAGPGEGGIVGISGPGLGPGVGPGLGIGSDMVMLHLSGTAAATRRPRRRCAFTQPGVPAKSRHPAPREGAHHAERSALNQRCGGLPLAARSAHKAGKGAQPVEETS